MVRAKVPQPAAPVLHLTAAVRVLRAHHHRPAYRVDEAAEHVKALALRVATGDASRDDSVLEGKLQRATGVSLAELAHFAEDWPN